MRIYFITLAVILLAGCAGRPGNPIAITQPEDASRSCATVAKELEQIAADMARIEPDAARLDASNKEIRTSFMSYVLLGLPFFSYDMAQGDQAELDALRLRKKHLELIQTEKNCTPAKP